MSGADLDQFYRLELFLGDLLSNPTNDPALLTKLQLKLERARPAFQALLDIPPKSPKERAQLEKGSFTYVATGTTYTAGPALAKEILFLSDSLGASEDLCASYVSFGINSRPRADQGRAESGLYVFLNERASLIRCLQAIWKGALSPDERLVASGLQRLLEKEADELTRGKGAEVVLDGGRRGTWVEKIIQTLESSKALISTLRTALSQPIASNALSVAAKHGASFSDETTEARIQRHEEERYALAQLLFLICTARQTTPNDLLLLLRQLQLLPSTDGTAVYLLAAILSALDSSDEHSAQQLYPLFTNAAFVKDVNATLASRWTVPQLRATVQLQWTVFLDTAARYVPNFETDGGEYVDHLTWQAIEAGVFAFLGRSVLAYKWDGDLDVVWGGIGAEFGPIGGGHVVEGAFQEYVTDQVELLVLEVVTNKISVLRKLRNREEDVASSSHRGGGHRTSRGGHEEGPLQVRHDLESLFLLISTIYRGAPDSGLKFWEEAVADTSSSAHHAPLAGRLSAFLRWGSECRPLGMMRAYYEMVAALASGPQSATYAFERLSTNEGPTSSNPSYPAPPSNNFSWASLFGALAFYTQNLPDRPAEAGPNAEGGLGEMPPEEVPLLRSFVRLLRQVVAYSDVARATLYDNQRHRPIASLFALLGRPIPLELKASLLGAIAAFSRPGGTFGVEVARRTWAALETSQILPTLAVQDARGGAGMGASRGRVGPLSIEGGIFTELEEVEVPNKVYPESTAFVQLLNTLIHTPSSLSPIRRSVEIDSQTIPDNLGAPQRAPGIDPYVHFVLDDILLKTSQREFADPRERWTVTETCLAFVEKCLGSYDLGPFLASAAIGTSRTASGPLAQLVLHPGFDVLTRILNGSELLETLLTIITAGYEAIDKDLAGTPVFTTCMLRCLRIVKRVFELQAPFLEVVLPSLGESAVHIPQDKLSRLKSVTPLDQSLLYNSEAVVQIALLVSCEQEDEVALLAVQILAVIAESPFFDVDQKFPDQSRAKLNRLVGLLEASPETLRILEGFVARLDAEVPESDLETGEWDGAEGEGGGSIRQAIRSAILDLLLQCTQPDRSGPNVAHLLLGFNVQSRPSEMEIDDPTLPDSPRTALHVILDLLAQNVASVQDFQISLLARHPVLAAKCYRLVRQLCLHQYTSAALSRYLRNREKFFLRQCLAMPFGVPLATEGALGEVAYTDGKRVTTSSAAVCAIFQSEAWLLESTALELNVLAAGNDTQRELELVTALFGNPTVADDDMPAFFDQGGLEQALPRMLEIFHSLDFDWVDSIQPNNHRLSFFAELRFESCRKTDSTGCEVYDFSALLALIGAARRELQSRGVLNTQAQQDEIKKETRCIIETLVIENHKREIQFARFHALRAWRSLLDITLTKAFHLLPVDNRHSLLLDLIIAILPPIAAPESDQAISELLSGAAVLLMTKLRDEGMRIAFANAIDSAQSVSPERLHAVLRAIIYAILQPGVSAVVRGNLYAVLLNYIQYSAKMASSSPALARSLADESNNSIIADDLISFDGLSSVGGTRKSSRRNALEGGNLIILQAAIDHLLPIICRDAAVGHEVWRTVAFTALDALVMVAEQRRATSKVLSILSKQGYLQSFVTSLKDAEVELQEALKPDPESLNALYIYEAQMSFLIRLASTREGAEKLLSAELLSKLAQCDYLGARPQVDASSMDFDGFLPPATERHHQLLLPALQLVVGALVSFGAETSVAARHAIAFVGGQRETLLIALKDCTAAQTVASLREAHLIVTLLGIVLPSISDEDLTTLSSFGGLHSALLGLSAKICGSQDWISKVAPSNDNEREEDQTLVLALRGSGTIFTEKVEALAESLEASILTYLSVATRKRSGTTAFRPVWLASVKYGDGAGAPTLGSAGAFLRAITNELARRLQDVSKLATMVEKFEEVDVAEIEEALSLPSEEGVDIGDHRHRVLQELLALQAKDRLQVTSSLHLLEISLLLYWRHVSFFLDPERVDSDVISSRPEFGLGLAESLRSRGSTISRVDFPALRESIADDFKPIAERLGSLELTQKTVGSSFRARESYLGTVVRRLQELLVEV